MCDTVQTDLFSSLSSPQGCVSGFLDAEMQPASNELTDLIRQCLTLEERDGCKLTVKPLKSPLTDDCWTSAGCKNIIINLSVTPFHEVASATLCRYLRGSFYFQSRGKDGIVPLINCATPDIEKLQTLIHETLKTLFSFPTFGCCAFYEKCSDAKKCLHQDPFYSYACTYRKNLESGKIFYGKSKVSNLDT